MRFAKFGRSIVSVLILFILVVGLCPSKGVSATGQEVKNIRVGYYEREKFLEGASEDAAKSGFMYEYIKTIADYSNWNLEYVYGSYSSLLDMLKNGEIDMMPGIIAEGSDSDGYVLSKFSMTEDKIVLYVKDANELTSLDFTYLNSGRVSICREFLDFATEWLETIGVVSTDIFCYENENLAVEALKNGTVDAFIGSEIMLNSDINMCHIFGSVEEKVGFSKDNSELAVEFSKAQMAVLDSKSGYYYKIYDKYFQQPVAVNKLSAAEKEWVENKKILKMGVLKGDMPFSDFDQATGSAKGLLVEFIKMAFENLKIDSLSVKYIYYDSHDELIEALESGEIDIAFPVAAYPDYEGYSGIMITEPIVTANMCIIFADDYSPEKMNYIAMPETRLAPIYVNYEFPESNTILCNSREAAVEAVLSGEAGCALFSLYFVEDAIRSTNEYYKLHYVTLTHEIEIALAVKKGNKALNSLVNRMVSVVPADKLNEELAILTTGSVKSTGDEIHFISHANLIIFQCIFFAIIIVGLIVLFVIVHKNKQVSEKLRKAKDVIRVGNSDAAVKEATIACLSDKYDFVCYVDGNTNTILNFRCRGVFAEYLDPDVDSISPARFDYTLNKLILPEDIDAFRENSNREKMIPILQEKGSSYVTCRINVNGEARFFRTNFAVDKVHDNCFIIGFSDVDDEMRRELAIKDEMDLRNKVIQQCSDAIFDREDTKDAIVRMLSLMAEYHNAERAFVFEINRSRTLISNTYEWCMPGAKSSGADLRDMDMFHFNDWFDVLRDDGAIFITSLDEDMSSDDIKRIILKNQNIDRLIVCPIGIKDSIAGFVGVANPKEHTMDSSIVHSVGVFTHAEILRGNQAGEEKNVLDSLFRSYLGVFYVNFEADTIRTYSIVDRHKERFRKLTKFSDAYKQLLELASPDEIRDGLESICHGTEVKQKLKEDGRFVISNISGTLDGYWYNIEAQFFASTADASCATLCIIDRTEQTRRDAMIQKELKEAKDQAEMANHAKSDFLSRMSHDIRTPINGVIGMTDIAQKYIHDRERVADCLAKIDGASHHLLSLINDVLDMSRIESGRIEIAENPVNLDTFWNNCISIIVAQIADKGINLIKEFREFSFPDVYADELHLRQVILNILSNAVKFTPNGGMIFLRAAETPINGETVRYHFEIEDTGIGMKKEFLDKIFDEFSQEDEGTRTNYKGTGLGMAIAKQLIEMMGGEINVSSEVDKGTLFAIDISLKISHEPVKSEETAPGHDIAGARILLVEDNELNLEISRELLESEGAEVVCAADGRVAVDIFKVSETGSFDAILMDVMMPNMDGYAATHEIRGLDRADAATVPIIAMTANAFDEDIRKAKESGMNAHLAKPIQTEIMIQTIANFLN